MECAFQVIGDHPMLNSESRNVTCHWCRRSKNRSPHIGKFICCSTCKKTYCMMCIETYPRLEPNKVGCVCCRLQCCCIFMTCNKKHTHCHTYIRTKKRHALDTNFTRYKKLKKDHMKVFEDINISDSRIENTQIEVRIIKTCGTNDISITEDESV